MSYSILWMGCLWSHSQNANAETLAAQANPPTRNKGNETAQADRPTVESDRAAIRSLWTANIAPAETSLPRRVASSVNPAAAQSHPGASRLTDRQQISRTASGEVSRRVDRQRQNGEVQAETLSNLSQSSVRPAVSMLSTEATIEQSAGSVTNHIYPIAQHSQHSQHSQINSTEQTSPTIDLETVNSETVNSEIIDPETVNSETVNSEITDPELADPETIDSPTIDPELGRLRLRDVNLIEPSAEQSTEQSTEQPTEQSSADESADPELGRLRLRDRPLLRTPAAQQPPPAEPQTIFLLGSIDYFRSDNILADDIDPVDDQILTVGASLLAVPRLGPQTQLVASVGGNLARYSDLTELNYSNVQLRLGIRQNLFPRTFGELSWTNQQFFSADDSRRFLNDHSLRLALWRRDPIAPRLNLDTFYQFRLSFTDPIDRSRLSNTLGAYLSYELQQNLEVGLDYQLSLTHFTQQEREDSYHQLTAQLSYDLSRESRISLYGGFSFGRSSDSSINFNSGILGVNLSASLALF